MSSEGCLRVVRYGPKLRRRDQGKGGWFRVRKDDQGCEELISAKKDGLELKGIHSSQR